MGRPEYDHDNADVAPIVVPLRQLNRYGNESPGASRSDIYTAGPSTRSDIYTHEDDVDLSNPPPPPPHQQQYTEEEINYQASVATTATGGTGVSSHAYYDTNTPGYHQPDTHQGYHQPQPQPSQPYYDNSQPPPQQQPPYYDNGPYHAPVPPEAVPVPGNAVPPEPHYGYPQPPPPPPDTKVAVAVPATTTPAFKGSGGNCCGCKIWKVVLIVVASIVGVIIILAATGALSADADVSTTRSGGGSGIKMGSTNTTNARPNDEMTSVVAYLNAITESGKTLVYYPTNTTPDTQYYTYEEAALLWLLELDPLKLTATTDVEKFRLVQRFALVVLYIQQLSYEDTWTNLGGWLLGDECDWYGITCSTFDFGALGDQNAVTAIELPSNNIKATIPADFALLGQMQTLDLSDNRLSGPIPSSLEVWTNLVYFNVSTNSLTGGIPTQLGAWTNLVTMNVSANALMGSMPTGFCDGIVTLEADYGEVGCACCTNY